jgi:hypothetical protein
MALDSGFLEKDLSDGLWGEPRGQQSFAVMIHELAHVIGLAHVDSKSEIMFFDATDPSLVEFQDGDQEGLAIAGRGACGTNILGQLIFGSTANFATGQDGANSLGCVIEELQATHKMFESRQESTLEELQCRVIPFVDESKDQSLKVSYSNTELDPEDYFLRYSEPQSKTSGVEQLRESRDFQGSTCDVLATYDSQESNKKNYSLYILCNGKVIQVVGSGFIPDRYFESPTLQSVVNHHIRS